ncbi:hypothetical protein CEUSTIGMA_g3864.t1 [Chlamydomonas eustigma]|uniref:AB hydrolase-1 domain-containing protein n=1 Tax=Chlamydomonas eustigma TaxID=1157962 RepID=A0A250X0E6_9CHLO|nr:hypothetical protein CEUSTIGMA_g3864.t1 [Chlamydomonas eustigma]|eukprot:GAX76419.1 hypothetical protein CEUSTIGMA_g3864.t1 [Chlamydomonas eustigma]
MKLQISPALSVCPLRKTSFVSDAPRVVRIREAVRVVKAVVDEETDQVDPITGITISKTSVIAAVAGSSVDVDGCKWAYRRTEPDEEQAKAVANMPILLLHGLGSSSYCYRNTLALLGGEGYDAVAPDWVGHGDSDKPAVEASGSLFDCSEEAYKSALGRFIQTVGIKQPFALVVHGFILGQYALLYALEHPDQIERLMVLNTPLSRKSKLRPELAAYKSPLPFLRPGNKPFNAINYNASGSPYAMAYSDAKVYNRPYEESPVASQIISKTMEKVDFPALLKRVDDGFMSWKKPTALCFGSSDTFLEVGSSFDFLENKRTNMKAMSIAAKVGHMPQEDYAEVLHEQLMLFLNGSPEDWTRAQSRSYKMTKKGLIEQ